MIDAFYRRYIVFCISLLYIFLYQFLSSASILIIPVWCLYHRRHHHHHPPAFFIWDPTAREKKKSPNLRPRLFHLQLPLWPLPQLNFTTIRPHNLLYLPLPTRSFISSSSSASASLLLRHFLPPSSYGTPFLRSSPPTTIQVSILDSYLHPPHYLPRPSPEAQSPTAWLPVAVTLGAGASSSGHAQH